MTRLQCGDCGNTTFYVQLWADRETISFKCTQCKNTYHKWTDAEGNFIEMKGRDT
jgi:hypothetical protein